MISGVPLATRKTVAEAHGRAQVLEVRREVILVSTTRNRTRSKRLVTDGHSANRDRVDNFKFALLFDVTSFIGHVVGGLSSPVQVPAAFRFTSRRICYSLAILWTAFSYRLEPLEDPFERRTSFRLSLDLRVDGTARGTFIPENIGGKDEEESFKMNDNKWLISLVPDRSGPSRLPTYDIRLQFATPQVRESVNASILRDRP